MGWIMRFFSESLKRLSEKRILGSTPPANLTGPSIWITTATDLGQHYTATASWLVETRLDPKIGWTNLSRAKICYDRSGQGCLDSPWQPQIELLNPWLIGLGVMTCYEATVFALGMFSFGKLHPKIRQLNRSTCRRAFPLLVQTQGKNDATKLAAQLATESGGSKKDPHAEISRLLAGKCRKWGADTLKLESIFYFTLFHQAVQAA